MAESLDLLTVQTVASEDVPADRADLLLTLKGATFFFGSAALQKAREVRQLVADLAQVGIPADAVEVVSAEVEVGSGLGKSTAATYQLRVRCTKLETFGDVLGAIAAQKQVQLNYVRWGYGDAQATKTRLLKTALESAKVKAALMAETLGCGLGAVHRVSETAANQHQQEEYDYASQGSSVRSRISKTIDLGMTITHTKQFNVAVEVLYHLRSA